MSQPIIHHKVLVTGGAGVLGRHLVQRLLSDGVVGVRVLVSPNEQVPAQWPGRVEVIRGGITKSTVVASAMEGCQTVVHLAALMGDGASATDHERVIRDGSAHVFAAALQHDALVVLTTSVCAYGRAVQNGFWKKDNTRFGHGSYSWARPLQERHTWLFRARGGRAVVVRPANIEGPGCEPWVMDACRALRRRLPVIMRGGRGNAALVAVDNTADFLQFMAGRPEAARQAFNLHDKWPVTWAQYFKDLAGLLDVQPPRSVPRWTAYMGTTLVESPWRILKLNMRPPVTREVLNLIAWDNTFTLDTAHSLGWRSEAQYAEFLAVIASDIRERCL